MFTSRSIPHEALALHATFDSPDVTTFCKLDDLGLRVVGQHLEPGKAVLVCRPTAADDRCRRCSGTGTPRDTVIRRLAHQPLGWRPTHLLVRVRRYRCQGCSHVWRQDMSAAAPPRTRLSRGAMRWALTGIVVQHLTVARVAESLAVSWGTANDAIIAEGKRMLIDNPHRFDGVKVIGVDGHAWCHTRNTVTDMALLRSQLADIRQQGYAFDDQELIDGAWGMAAPIRRPDGAVAASIGFIAPMIRLDEELTRRGRDMVRTAARMVQEALARAPAD